MMMMGLGVVMNDSSGGGEKKNNGGAIGYYLAWRGTVFPLGAF